MENEKVMFSPDSAVEETYEKYAQDLNTHADQCEVCATARKTSTTHGVCDEGRKLVEAWSAFVEAEREKFFSDVKRLTVNGRFDAETTDVPKD